MKDCQGTTTCRASQTVYQTKHYFKHNFTTDLIYAGVPMKTVHTIMGHENIQTTMDIYTDVRYDNDEVIEKLDNYLK